VISDGGVTILYQGHRYGLGIGGDRFAICDLSVDVRPIIWQFPCDDPGWRAACQAYASLEKLSGAGGAASPTLPISRPVERGPRRRWPRTGRRRAQ
jgi:hypothetical protein